MEEPAARSPRRQRYAGRHPRRFEDKYKEHRGDAETLHKVEAAGKTPAGRHRPIMVDEVMAALEVAPGETVADGTLGYGGHTTAFLTAGARVIAMDVDPHQLPRTTERLRAEGFEGDRLVTQLSNFAGLPRVLAACGAAEGVDVFFADLGVSSMQIDDPARGFSWKTEGPLDMRLNPSRGMTAEDLLRKSKPAALQALLEENADEPRAALLAETLAGGDFSSTRALAAAIRAVLQPQLRLRADAAEQEEKTVRRVFQALRIAVNDEFAALDTLLRVLPPCLRPGGRAALLTFHSGEDRRVKKAFAAWAAEGAWHLEEGQPQRPGPQELHGNPRSSSARLRWIRRAG